MSCIVMSRTGERYVFSEDGYVSLKRVGDFMVMDNL